ncbi:TlpA family protein disulfide reductase [Fulvivirga sp. RKSG066]|uniref:TlpA family protein disulfide reductase n=1 Tax=Fulvivirga aurantia TaxID=2529383 RepID=UPI0012BC99BD|nr:TlpA disulfide reductase family protein [Fulvivirga aurantia]MTI22778.1 TlpA family protein disulfide reductase [Fulvivirga aurantia]
MTNYLSVLAFLFLFSCGTATREQTESVDHDNVHADLRLEDMEGNDITINRSETIFINFWATWCAPCIKEMPSLENMQSKLDQDKITFYYASSEPKSKISKFAEQKPWQLNYVHLASGLESLNINALPTTMIIKNGEIIWTQTGMREWDSEESIEEIKEIIK